MQQLHEDIQEVHHQWSSLIQMMRHQQANDLQVIQGYLKINQPERAKNCLQQMMERTNQERMLHNFMPLEWYMRLLPYLYEQNRIHFDFSRLAHSCSAIHEELKAGVVLISWLTQSIQFFAERLNSVISSSLERNVIPSVLLTLECTNERWMICFESTDVRINQAFQQTNMVSQSNTRNFSEANDRVGTLLFEQIQQLNVLKIVKTLKIS